MLIIYFKDENSKEDYDICADDLVDSLLDMDTDNERKQIVLVSTQFFDILETFFSENIFLYFIYFVETTDKRQTAQGRSNGKKFCLPKNMSKII